jgi:hypothetical protein
MATVRRSGVPWRLTAVTLAVVAGSCVVAVIAFAMVGVDSRVLFEDFQKIGGVPFYTGIMSNLGVVLWCCSSATSLFAAFVLRTRPPIERRGKPEAFLASWAVFGIVLALDELLLVHERVAPHYLRIPEEVLVLGYAAVTGYLVLRWWVLITRRTPAAILWICFGAFALSLLGEYVVQSTGGVQTPLSISIEDGLKLLGIALWFLYFGTVAFRALAGGRGSGVAADFRLAPTSATVRPDDRSIGGEPAGLSNNGSKSPPMRAGL